MMLRKNCKDALLQLFVLQVKAEESLEKGLHANDEYCQLESDEKGTLFLLTIKNTTS